VRDADRVIGILEAEGKGPATLILNRLNPAMVKKNDMLSANDVLDLLAIDLLGIVPEDQGVIVGSNRGAPVAADPKSKAGQAFRNIARRIAGEDVPFLELDGSDGLWGRIQKLAGRD
jgi:septum site-determining protein MinD